MIRYSGVALFMIVLLLVSCSRSTTKVAVVPPQEPQISKTLTESQPERFLKRKVAIARFSNETKYGKGFFTVYDENNDPLGKQAMDILSARLAETGKFILLERADIEKIKEELGIGNLGSLEIGADYLIVGSVSEFGRKTTSDVSIFNRSKKQTAFAKVNVRLIDVRTGQVIYSEEGEGEAFSETGTVLGIGDRAGYDTSLNDKVISAAISSLVNNLIENLLDLPWRSYILSYEDNNYIISGGKSQGIKAGDVFTVYQRGKEVKNPQTNILIELPGKEIGKIKVLSLLGDTEQNEVAVCTKVSGEIPVEDFTKLYIQE
jgi:curli biogenesis system outer membrane secretion channel CsgG